MPFALVTGAGIRVGRAIAVHLARAGFDLLLHAHQSAGAVKATAREVESHGRRATILLADLSSLPAVRSLADSVRAAAPALDALVHNAGAFEHVPFSTVTEAQYRRMQAINVEAPFFLTQALLPALHAAPAPCVVTICDVGGERPVPGYSHYSVSKAGLVMLTRALAVELAPRVRVNGVSPGTVLFPEDFTDAQRAATLERVPLRREGTPGDIAGAVVYLVKDAPYVTGLWAITRKRRNVSCCRLGILDSSRGRCSAQPG